MFSNNKKFFDDLARAATGAVGAMSGLRQQIQSEIKSQVSKFMVEMDFVARDEFEVVQAMAREARLQNQKLEARIAQLEKSVGLRQAGVKTPTRPAVKKTAARKPAAKKAARKGTR